MKKINVFMTALFTLSTVILSNALGAQDNDDRSKVDKEQTKTTTICFEKISVVSERKKHSGSFDGKNLLVYTLPPSVDVCFSYPFFTWKNLQQNGKKVELNSGTIKQLYKGFPVFAASVIPYKSFLLSSHQLIRSSLISQESETSFAKEILAGGSAGAFAAVFGCPIDRVMVQLQLDEKKTFRDVFKQTIKAGPQNFFRGLCLTSLNDGIFSSSLLGLSTVIKGNLPADFDDYPKVKLIFSSALAGQFAALVSHPIDTIKSQIQGTDPQKPAPKVRELLQENIARNGFIGLYRGIIPRACKITTSSVVLLSVKDALEKWVAENKE